MVSSSNIPASFLRRLFCHHLRLRLGSPPPHRPTAERRRLIPIDNNKAPWQLVKASSSASSAASPATLTTMNVMEHPLFKIVRTDGVAEYGATCIIACEKCDKCDIACDQMRSHARNFDTCNITCDITCDISCDKCGTSARMQ